MPLTSVQSEAKPCTCCGWVKPLFEFSRRSDAPNATHASQCKMCRSVKLRKHNNTPEKLANNEAWRRANMPRVLELQRSRRARQRPELKQERFQKYAEKNRALLAEKSRRYQANKIGATPWWADKDAMLKFYEKAHDLSAETGVLHHVDHIVPLTSEIVCGLHVPANLQVLTIYENSSKKNYYWPDMP